MKQIGKSKIRPKLSTRILSLVKAESQWGGEMNYPLNIIRTTQQPSGKNKLEPYYLCQVKFQMDQNFMKNKTIKVLQKRIDNLEISKTFLTITENPDVIRDKYTELCRNENRHHISTISSGGLRKLKECICNSNHQHGLIFRIYEELFQIGKMKTSQKN